MQDNKNYEAWHTVEISRNEFLDLDPKKKLLYICQLGHLAPSTHNTQPWRFLLDIKNNIIHLFLDKKYILPASDVDGRQSIISLGCAIENMITASHHLGCNLNVTLEKISKDLIKPKNFIKNNTDRYIHIAHLNITYNNDLAPHPLFTAILNRKVTRAEYDTNKLISEKIIQSIKNISIAKEIEIQIVSDRLRKMMMAEFQSQADSFVMNTKKFSTELGQWLLPNETKTFLGMPGIGFGLNDEQAIRIHRGLLGETHLEPEDNLRFALGAKSGIEKAPIIGFITMADDNIQHWINVGRTLEKTLLTLTNNNICFAIHAGIVEVQLINRMFATSFGSLNKIGAFFRAGYIQNNKDLDRPHSPRLPLSNIILEEITDKF